MVFGVRMSGGSKRGNSKGLVALIASTKFGRQPRHLPTGTELGRTA